MVALVFDAAQHSPEPRIRLTFGRSRTEVKWADQRAITFDELANALASSSVGGKDGPCYTPAVFDGYARKMDKAAQIDVAVLDADCGHSFEEIAAAVRARGWRAIIHSTYSHLSDSTMVAAGAAEKWMADHPGAGIAGYMLEKKGYLPRVVRDARIVDEVSDGAARNLIVKHNPCPKFRVILPLEHPWIAADFASQSLANATWRERIGALSSALKLHHDQSCVDTSRLFYLPRRRDAAQEYEFAVLQGNDCPLWDLPDATEAPLMALSGRAQASRAPQLHVVKTEHKSYTSPDGEYVDLTEWAAKYALRFEVVDALRARAPSVFSSRRSGVKHHMVCPNAGDHVSGGAEGTGTFAINASQLKLAQMPEITSGFVIHCMHNGCAGHDRLDHLRALLVNGALSIGDLTHSEFLTPDIPRVDMSAIVKSSAPEDAPDAIVETENAGNISPALYTNLPPIMAAMHDWMMATAPKPQPVLSLGAILAFCAAAIGQRVKLGVYGVRPNIYVLGIGYSGSGKERPLSACKQMARAAGLFTSLIGVEEVASDTGIVTSVIRAPHQVMLIDEVSFLLSATNNKNAAAHMSNITGTLLKLYSSSHTTYQSKSYADFEKVRTVDQPCVSLYGTTTPSGLADALTSKDVTSGLLSRMVLFDAGDNDPRITPPQNMPMPGIVVDWLQAWNKVDPIQNPLRREGGEQVMEPRVVMMTQDAAEIATAFEGEMHAAKIRARARGTDALYVRALENALKFALIRACAVLPAKTDSGPCIDESELRVDATIMRWAAELSRATVARMETAAHEIADTVFAQHLKALRGVIKRGGLKGATMRDITKTAAGKHPKKTLDDMLDSLASSGDAFWVSDIKTAGRKRAAWVHKDYIGHHAPQLSEGNENDNAQ